MKIVVLSSFDHFYANEVVDRCMRLGIPIKAIVCVGQTVQYTDRRMFWEYTNFAEGMHLVDLAKYAIPTYIVKDLNNPMTIKILEKLQPDLLLQGGVGIIKKMVLDVPTIGILNSHPGLLPEYRGCMAVEWSILNDDPVGATCHFVDEGIDTGPIICSQKMEITREMNYYYVRCKVFSHQADIMIKGIRKVLNGFKYKDAEKQKGGHYNKPMDSRSLEKVKALLKAKKYSHYLT